MPIRFLAGGLITSATGLIARKFGPVVAGLFLAFPAIFPATATLIAKHEKLRKREASYAGTLRGRAAAAVDAAGTAVSALALIVFALPAAPHSHMVFLKFVPLQPRP